MPSPVKSAPDIAAYINIRSAKSPALSFDGELLAYLSDESGTHQIWTQAWPDGAPLQLTDMPEPIGAFSFQPGTKSIVFTMDCGGDERHQLWWVDGDSRALIALTDDPGSVHVWGAWSPLGDRIAYTSNARDKHHMDVYVMDVATRNATCIWEGTGYRQVLAFSPDGTSLLVLDWTVSDANQNLYLVDIATGQREALLAQDSPSRFLKASFKRDGTGLYFLADTGQDFVSLGHLSFANGAVSKLAARDCNDIVAMAVSRDQDWVAYVVDEAGWDHVYVLNLREGTEWKVPGLPAGTVSSMLWLPNGSGLVMALESAARSPDIWHVDLSNAGVRRLTNAPKGTLKQEIFVEPGISATSSFDGLSLPFFIYRPKVPAPPNGYPVVVMVHGGPAMAWRSTFRADVQYLLACGVMVIAPNVRGSTGYGRPYEQLDDKHLRMNSVADLSAIRKWLAAQSDIAQTRVAVFGRSYGGFMVLAALTEQAGDWSLGINFYGIANFQTMLTTTGPWRRYLRAAEYGDPVHDHVLLEKISPIHKMDRVRVPVLVVQGLDDPRVPPGESEMVYSVLRGLGRPVEYLRIPHEGHGFARLDSQQKVFATTADFLARFL